MTDQIIKYILESGGIWGILFILSLLGNIFVIKQSKLFSNEEQPKDKESEKIDESNHKAVEAFIIESKEFYGSINEKINNLVTIHSLKDEDGVPNWYTKKSTLDSISEIKKNTSKLIDMQIAFSSDMEKLSDSHADSLDEYKELLRNYHETLQDLALGLDRLKIDIEKRS